MATKFLEPGGDATFNVKSTSTGGFWKVTNGTPLLATDFTVNSHARSIRTSPNGSQWMNATVLADSGSRISFYLYIVAYPSATSVILEDLTAGLGAFVFTLRLTSTGVLQLWNAKTAQIGINGSTLSIGTWYRLSLAYTITNSTTNRFELFKNGVPDISVTNATISTVNGVELILGDQDGDAVMDLRFSDIYVDDSASLIDMGDVKIASKRPNANGTANNFSTQIGTGASGFGTGHAPQVNERPLSNTNGWSIVAVGATTEEYNIEPATGLNNLMKEDGSFVLQESSSFMILDDSSNINLTTQSIVDYLGWVDAKALLSETGQIVLNNVATNISLTSAETMFTKFAGSTTYPAGTGTDIGMISDATATTVSLYECGIIFAYIPASAAAVVSPIQQFQLLGVGT